MTHYLTILLGALSLCVFFSVEKAQAQCSFPISPTISDASCHLSADGGIILGLGGSAPHTFLWSNGSSNRDLTNIVAGNYSVTVTDATGCIETASFIVNAPAAIVANEIAVPTTCAGNDGSVTLNPTGGVSPYTYLWSNGQTTATVTGLAASPFSCTITDANGCLQPVSMLVPNGCFCNVQPIINMTPVSCYGLCDGSVTLTPTNGTGPFVYNWSNGNTGNTATGLCSGLNTVTITDNSTGCNEVLSVVVSSPTEVFANIGIVDETCTGGTGVATAFPTGGASGYTFLWSNGGTTASIANLSAGIVSVTVTDISGCTTVETDVVGLNNNTLVANSAEVVSNVNCNGGADGRATLTIPNTPNCTYQWSSGSVLDTANNLTAGTHQVTVTTPIGCTVIGTVVVTEPTRLASNVATSFIDCQPSSGLASIFVSGGTAPYSYIWSNGEPTGMIDSLSAGEYIVTVTDANACTHLDTAVITQSPLAPTIASSSYTSPNCSNSLDGRIDITMTPAGNYTYIWSNGDTTQNLMNINGGTYYVQVTDTATGCSAIYYETLTGPTPIVVNLNLTPATAVNAADGLLSATATGGVSPYTYLWSTGDTGPIVSSVPVGDYSVIVTDANNCIDSVAFVLGAVSAIEQSDLVEAFRLYPNPTNGIVNLEVFFTDQQQGVVEIYDVLGKLVDITIFDGHRVTEKISLENFSMGTYFVQLKTSTGLKQTRKLIVY